MARTKAVPAPVSMDALESGRQAVPLVPKSTDDCCGRVQQRGPADTRESAQDWLAFLDALDLVAETSRGYERRQVEPAEQLLARRFRENVYGVAEVLDALEDGPLTPEVVFERTRSIVPTWERNRHADWEAVWRERTQRVLQWAVVFGLVTADGGRFGTR